MAHQACAAIPRDLCKHFIIQVYSGTVISLQKAMYHTVQLPKMERFPENPSQVISFVLECNLKAKGQSILAHILQSERTQSEWLCTAMIPTILYPGKSEKVSDCRGSKGGRDD